MLGITNKKSYLCTPSNETGNQYSLNQFIDMQIGTAVFNVKTIEATEIDNGFFGKPSSASAERSIRITTECGGTISLKLLSDKPEKLQILDMELVPKHPEEIGSKETAA